MLDAAEIPLLLAIFLDLVGFGMAFPDIQLRAEAFGAPGWLIGVLLASLFVVQFLASPWWGQLSDRIGRKPVMVLCTALSALSMLVYAEAHDVWLILFSRILGGLAAANVVVAQAYLADVTPEEVRPAAMGRIGAAISGGLILGPPVGGLLASIGGNHLLGLVAAASSGFGVATLVIFLKGRPASERRASGEPPVINFTLLRDLPSLRRLFTLAAISWFALACLEGTFGRLIHAKLGMGQREFGIIFGFESVISVLIQSFLLALLVKRFQSRSLLRFGYFCQGIGLTVTPFAPGLGILLVASGIYSSGAAIANPTVNAECSVLAPPERQGELFGLLQGARSLGFLIGPILGGALFDWRPEAPYALAGSIALLAALVAPAALRRSGGVRPDLP